MIILNCIKFRMNKIETSIVALTKMVGELQTSVQFMNDCMNELKETKKN